MISATICGWAQVGGGPWRHAEYRIEVGFDSQQWIIYRRYASFAELDKTLRAALGPEKADNRDVWTAELPRKIGSSAASSLATIVEIRMVSLQLYLLSILSYFGNTAGGERVAFEIAFNEFFDSANKGASGAALELGSMLVSRESFARVRDARHLLTMWHNYFIVVTTKGVLYIVTGLYEKPSSAVLTLPLVGSDLKVVAKKGDPLQVDIVGQQRSIMMRFTSADETAAWMRMLSDYVTPHPTGKLTAEQKRKAQRKAREDERQSAELRKAEMPVEIVRTQGTGNTADELSNVYGM